MCHAVAAAAPAVHCNGIQPYKGAAWEEGRLLLLSSGGVINYLALWRKPAFNLWTLAPSSVLDTVVPSSGLVCGLTIDHVVSRDTQSCCTTAAVERTMLTFEKWGLGRFLNTCTTLLHVLLLALTLGHARVYVVDDSEGLGRRFDGIGGLSGGGVRN